MKALIVKDLRILLSDAKQMAVLLLMPVVLCTILGMALSGTFENGEGIGRTLLGVVWEGATEPTNPLADHPLFAMIPEEERAEILASYDPEEAQTLFFDTFLGAESLRDHLQVQRMTAAEGEEALAGGRVHALLVLPPDYFDSLALNLMTPFEKKTEVVVRGGENNRTRTALVMEIMTAFERTFESRVGIKNAAITLALQADRPVDADLFGELEEEPLQLTVENAGRGASIDAMSYYSAAMLAMFLLFAAGTGSAMLLEEQLDGTLGRMRLAGVSTLKILLGKATVISTIALLQIVVMLAYAGVAFGVRWGDPLALVLLSITLAVTIGVMGLFFALWTLNRGDFRVSRMLESVVFQIMALLGGSFIPVEVLPAILRPLSYLPLNGVALRAFLTLMRGEGIAGISLHLGLLMINLLVFALLAYRQLRTGGVNDAVHS